MYLIGTPWQIALGLGLFLPLLIAYMSLVNLIQQHQLSWELRASRWYWLLVFPLIFMVSASGSLVVTLLANLSEIFLMIAVGMFATGSFLIAAAGLVVLVLDLAGKTPLKRP